MKRDEQSWADIEEWDAAIGGRGRGVAAPARMPRSRRTPYLLGSWVLLALTVVPLAVLGRPGQPVADLSLAGNVRGESVDIQVRNRSRGETGLIASSDDYALRLSNSKEGGGGGAVYGCRAPAAAPSQDLACLYADNLRDGKAFLFRTRNGGPAGHIDVGDAAQAPFTTNGRGMVANLNAEMVGGFTAQQLIGAAPGDPVPGPAGPQGPRGPEGPPGPSTGPAGGALTGSYPDPELADDAVGSEHIRSNSVGASELASSSVFPSHITTSAVGPRALAQTTVRENVVTVPANGTASVTASCLSGGVEQLITGGYAWAFSTQGGVTVTSSVGNTLAWSVRGVNETGVDRDLAAYAMCLG